MNRLDLLPQISVYGLWLLVVFTIAELLQAKRVDGEIVRKVIHIGVGNIIILAWVLQAPMQLGITFSVLAAGLTLLSYRIQILKSMNSVGRKSLGTFFYAVSIGILLGLFWHSRDYPFAVSGILVMTWGDALAALIGQTWGSHRYQVGSNSKSWEGSLTMWVVSSSVVAIVLGSVFGFSPLLILGSMGIGIIATILEVFSWWGMDNLTVPIVTGMLSYELHQLLYG
jgi:phytol kinase